MSSPDDHLVVWLAGRPAADLHRGDARGPVLAYRESYLDGPHIPLSPVFATTTGVQSRRRAAAFLDHLLPDNPDTRQLWARHFQVPPDTFDLLAVMGEETAGALQFLPAGATDRRDARYEPVSDAKIGRRLRELRTDQAGWTLPDERWSLAGAQAKFTLAELDGRWHRPVGSAASTHILKPGIFRLHHQGLVEHVTMRAARLLGMTTAGTRWCEFDGEPALVITRFDRRGTDPVHRIHQVDMCQALGRGPKYETDGGPGAADVAGVLRSVSSDPQTDLYRFADALMFALLTESPDAHAKNYALLLTETAARLAPLYDMATALPYEHSGLDLSVAMTVGGQRHRPRVLPRHLITMAERDLGIDAARVLDRYRTMAGRLPGAFEAALDELPGAVAADELRDRILPRLRELTDSALHQLDTSRYQVPPPDPGRIWVHPHTRSGRRVEGYWRAR
ncbi:type II toxin-antitoxin system HipA family toxin [Acidipropionibacterium virtanenii]|uniref:Serine/threonine-protein kinase HipA n=1 Tax=Acidipropionibacterium virtanenii TaxID=2057246 RepID=A0A344UUC0_9ACTN|nr:type II toxin-antitoxin system HipA family toxin [Acidipropionibacterium virtanenii]AXE38868.1 Serine/threonine-protein kinase HipA [Acidipropionibacterium virtanenii]